MQILAIVIWNHDGASRVIRFRPGRLNVITGRSRSGKSALLDIVEYCLGRDHRQVPSGPITATVAWYGLIVDIRGQRVFIGRPEPKPGHVSTQIAMLRIGADAEPPPFADLAETTDTVGLRSELGRLIGISDSQVGISSPVTSVYAPTVGHAAWFCLQKQDEVASQTQLFHRQGEDGISRALREVLPFFLGAVAGDATLRKAELAQQRRNLLAAQTAYDAAVRSEAEAETTVRVLLEQAFAQGLTDTQHAGSTEKGMRLLRRAVEGSLAVSIDDTEMGRRERQLRVRRDDLRQQLRQLGERQALLEEDTLLRGEYLGAVNDQVDRLRTVELLPKTPTTVPPDICPVCNQNLPEPDATVDEITALATQLSASVQQIAATTPGRRQAQATLDSSATRLRAEIRQVENALSEITTDVALVGVTDERSYHRGRLSIAIETLERDRSDLVRRRDVELRSLQARVAELEEGLDPEAERAELDSRLSLVNTHLSEIAQTLQLEHSEGPVRLDVRNLTVVADTAQGAVPLARIGSAENWMGYHIAVHLALHHFFTQADRPVPRFLMLDQPTQAYYPPDRQPADGAFLGDDDRQAVARLFKLLNDWVIRQEGQVQVIVVDHADLDEDWFGAAVTERWRGPDAGLIPRSWLSS